MQIPLPAAGMTQPRQKPVAAPTVKYSADHTGSASVASAYPYTWVSVHPEPHCRNWPSLPPFAPEHKHTVHRYPEISRYRVAPSEHCANKPTKYYGRISRADNTVRSHGSPNNQDSPDYPVFPSV